MAPLMLFGGGGHPTPFSTSKETLDNIKEHQRTSRMTSYQCPQTTTIGTTRDITRIPPDTTLIPKHFGIRVEFLNGYHPDTILIPFQRKTNFIPNLFGDLVKFCLVLVFSNTLVFLEVVLWRTRCWLQALACS